MRLVRGLLPFERPLARIGHRQRARDHQRLRQTARVARGEHDASDAGVERQQRKFASQRRQPALVVDRAQFLQQLIAVGNGPRSWPLEERERVDSAQVERGHPQDHRGQRRAQYFRIREFRARRKIIVAVQPHADAVLHAAATAGPLVGRGLRHLFDLQQRRLVPHRVALDPRQARVDHVANSGHRERGFRDVGRKNDAPAIAWRKDALLVRDRQAREQRQYFHLAGIGTPGQSTPQQVPRFPDLAFTGQEHEDVARPLAPQDLDGVDDRLFQLLLVIRLVLRIAVGRDSALPERPIAHFDREHAAGDLDDRRGRGLRPEVPRETFGVERGRRDDHLEVGPRAQQLRKVPQQEIDVEAAFVRLVDDDRVVGFEAPVALRLREKDAVRHQLDVGVRRRAVGKAHLVADRPADRLTQLVRDARRHRARRDPPRLRVADKTPFAATRGKADLGQLRRLARAGLATDDDDRVRADQACNLVGALCDRQVRRIGDGRLAPDARLALGDRALEILFQARPLGVVCTLSPGAFDAAGEPCRVPGHGQRQSFDEGVRMRGGR